MSSVSRHWSISERTAAKHLTVIKDVHDSIQIMRKTINGQRLTEDEGKALGRQLDSITQELSSLEKVTAGKDLTKLWAKVAWALKSTETDRSLQRLENHKTSLMLLLQALNLYFSFFFHRFVDT